MKNKIGVGIVTYNREEMFKKCVASIPDVDTIVVVNDGTPYAPSVYPSKVKEVIQHSSNKCVGVSKNEALRYMMQDDCDHLFLIEDDTEILQPNAIEKYIKTAEGSGIWHLNYGPGSPFNRVQDPNLLKLDLAGRHLLDQNAKPNPRLVYSCDNGEKVALYQHTVGMFTYCLRGIIKAVGYHDEKFRNAWEHVDLTYRIIKLGLHPPFWWFADIADSDQYVREMKDAIQNSVIANNKEEWQKNVTEGAKWYSHKHGHFPAQISDTHPQQVQQILSDIEKKYARKVL